MAEVEKRNIIASEEATEEEKTSYLLHKQVFPKIGAKQDKPSIYDYKLEDLEQKMVEMGQKKFRARQLYKWLYEKRVTSFEEMTNLSKETIQKLKKDFNMERPIKHKHL